MRIREYELPFLKRAVVISVRRNGNVVQRDPEVFIGHRMDRDNNTELSETKSLYHQNKFQDTAIEQVDGQVVHSKMSKVLTKYKMFNNIETTSVNRPIKLEQKCMPLKKKEYPTATFLKELKESVSKLRKSA